jgi:hypothetical protein
VLICGKSRRGDFQIRRKSRHDRMRAKLREIKEGLRLRWHLPIPDTGKWLGQVVAGYFAYHAVPTNSAAIGAFRYHVTVLWHRRLCRRSQKARLVWPRMAKLADDFLPKPRILHGLHPLSRRVRAPASRRLGSAPESLNGRRLISNLDIDAEIIGRVIPEARGTRLHRISRPNYCWQRLIGDIEQLGRVLGLIDGLGHDHGDRLADKADFIGRHRVVLGRDRIEASNPYGHIGAAHEPCTVRDCSEPVSDVVLGGGSGSSGGFVYASGGGGGGSPSSSVWSSKSYTVESVRTSVVRGGFGSSASLAPPSSMGVASAPNATSSSSVARGGFGATAAAHGAGG